MRCSCAIGDAGTSVRRSQPSPTTFLLPAIPWSIDSSPVPSPASRSYVAAASMAAAPGVAGELVARRDRAAGAVMGLLVGDALGLGPHWFYDLEVSMPTTHSLPFALKGPAGWVPCLCARQPAWPAHEPPQTHHHAFIPCLRPRGSC